MVVVIENRITCSIVARRDPGFRSVPHRRVRSALSACAHSDCQLQTCESSRPADRHCGMPNEVAECLPRLWILGADLFRSSLRV